MLKARVKQTGAILYVEEITNNAIFLRHPFDPKLKAACTPQEVDLIGEDDKVQIDWEQRRYEIAKEAMGAFISSPSYQYCVNNNYYETIYSRPWSVAEIAVEYAEALIEELMKGEKK